MLLKRTFGRRLQLHTKVQYQDVVVYLGSYAQNNNNRIIRILITSLLITISDLHSATVPCNFSGGGDVFKISDEFIPALKLRKLGVNLSPYICSVV